MRVVILLSVLFCFVEIYAQHISSPDGKLSVQFKIINGKPVYSLEFNKQVVIKESTLGIDILEQPDFIDGFTIDKIDTSKFNESWKPVWGEVNEIVNNYNELKITLSQLIPEKRLLVITFRLFNDGLRI